jgi:hypothetical protein
MRFIARILYGFWDFADWLLNVQLVSVGADGALGSNHLLSGTNPQNPKIHSKSALLLIKYSSRSSAILLFLQLSILLLPQIFLIPSISIKVLEHYPNTPSQHYPDRPGEITPGPTELSIGEPPDGP